ncbi:glutamine synthetase family protein [Coralliovum pocilloporae]|uniref:glutamine synthetase family protein n=1 Tax=Coralliovum pocilloporae TaxID=3066369 RepID=UPI003307A687
MAPKMANFAELLSSAPKPQTSDELRALFKKGRIDEVECVVPDIAGVARGKAMPAAKFSSLNPTYLPISIFFQSITGEYVEVEDENYWTEKDIQLIPDLNTLRAVPWAQDRTVQVIHDLRYPSGEPVEYAPRNVLRRVLSYFEAEGWQPVIAPEMEFYLTQKNIDPDYALEPPVGRSGRQSVGKQAYSMMAVDEYESVIEAIYEFAEVQGMEIDTVIQEGGAAQIEINLLHGHPLELADQVFVFKRLIREAAFRHDCYATFMAKPMDNEPGSAMHIHQSMIDTKTGKNIFSDDEGNETDLFRHFLGGQQYYMPAAMCLLAPYVNSYRRLVVGSSAPINVEWGVDNRSVGLRVPNSPPEARRIENRIVGADTNPYIAIAACLAAGYLGMRDKIVPRAQFSGDAYDASFGLPRGLLESLTEFKDATALHEILGPNFSELYRLVKAHEFEEFMQVISPWEREHLLLTV